MASSCEDSKPVSDMDDQVLGSQLFRPLKSVAIESIDRL